MKEKCGIKLRRMHLEDFYSIFLEKADFSWNL